MDESKLKTRFAKNVYDFRHKQRMSQAELAAATEVSADTIGKYERGVGMPTLKTICTIADALKCEPNDLFGWAVKEVA